MFSAKRTKPLIINPTAAAAPDLSTGLGSILVCLLVSQVFYRDHSKWRDYNSQAPLAFISNKRKAFFLGY